MPIKVYKVAYIFDKKIFPLTTPPPIKTGDLSVILTNMEKVNDYYEECKWSVELTIGDKKSERLISLELPPFINKKNYELSKKEPIFISMTTTNSVSNTYPLLFFKDQFFMPERMNIQGQHEEIILHIKKIVYSEEAEIIKLREEIKNIETTFEYTKSNTKRKPIPDNIKALVWTRDKGSCLICNSTKALHFDHIIPIAKGGSNHAENIQILCQTCNLKKSDKIAPGL